MRIIIVLVVVVALFGTIALVSNGSVIDGLALTLPGQQAEDTPTDAEQPEPTEPQQPQDSQQEPAAPVVAIATPSPEVSPTPATSEIVVYYPRYTQKEVQFIAVKRTIARTPAIGKATIEALLQGPTDEEKAIHLEQPIPANTKLLSLKIVDGIAYADFDEALQEGVGGSLQVMAIRQSITKTLQQFSTVDNVVISINGRTEDILQP